MTRETTSLGGRRTLIVLYGATLALLALVYIAGRVVDRPYSYFTRDPVQVLGGPPIYIGFLSNVGILLWAGTAAACLVAGETLRRLRQPAAGLLFAAGGVSALLVLDDVFLFHERSDAVGVPQAAVGLVYGVVLGLFVVRYRESLRRTEWRLLAAAAALFAGSVFVDWFAEATDAGLSYDGFEDAVKFVGIVTWTAYFSRLAVLSLVDAVRAR